MRREAANWRSLASNNFEEETCNVSPKMPEPLAIFTVVMFMFSWGEAVSGTEGGGGGGALGVVS